MGLWKPQPSDPVGATGNTDTCLAGLDACGGCSAKERCAELARTKRKPASVETQAAIAQKGHALSLLTQDNGADAAAVVDLILAPETVKKK